MKRRGRIPPEYWRALVRAARMRGHPELTAELLVDLHAREPASQAPGFAEQEAAPIEPRQAEQGQGHFSRHKHARCQHFRSAEEIEDHLRALREEWSHR
jgi:hypothetical protein